MEDHGMTATGLWEVINNNHEVIMIWATTVDAWVSIKKTVTLVVALTIPVKPMNGWLTGTLPPLL